MTRRLSRAWHGLLLAGTFTRRELRPDPRAVGRVLGTAVVLVWLRGGR